MSDVISNLLSELDIHPVLIDVGASGTTPEIWDSIAQHSIYVGFDPDLREIQELPDNRFHRAIIVNEAITSQEKSDKVSFYLTKSPYCSSVLKPDSKSLANFIFSDYFVIERETKVRATTLNAVIERLSLTGVDWLKSDSQGMDFKIFNSLSKEISSKVLAVDIEPGLIDAYIGEDLFVDAHQGLVNQGFWLSDIKICGEVRLKKLTLDKLTSLDSDLNLELLNFFHKKSPAWCEARYLRTIDWLTQGNSRKRDYVLLWVFSLLDRQLGFAIELAFEYERRFGSDKVSQIMLDEAIWRVKRLRPKKRLIRTLAGKLLPTKIKQWIKGFIVNS
jgi:FkbM family methyltransferase